VAGAGAPARRQPAPAGWRRLGQSLVRELLFRDFAQAFGFLERLARDAVDYSRRPDMCIFGFNRVRLTIANPHHSDLTEAELRLAGKVDAIVRAQEAAQREATDGRAWKVPPTVSSRSPATTSASRLVQPSSSRL
jgi:4a-hydroxytetrahydrobiopterin dehydratase